MKTITKDMPEPKNVGPFIISGTYSEIIMGDFFGSGIWHILPSDADYYWSEMVDMFADCTIESLAEHDKRIRRDALTLSDDEVKGLDGLLEKELETQTFIEAIGPDDWNIMLSNIFAAVAESRERKS